MNLLPMSARLALFLRRSWRAKTWLAAGCILSLYGGASALAALGDEMLARPMASGNRVNAELALAQLDEQIARLAEHVPEFITEDRLRAGDTIPALLQRLGVNDAAALTFVRNDALAKRLYQLRPGRAVAAKTDAIGNLVWLEFPDAALRGSMETAPDGAALTHLIRIDRSASGFKAEGRAVVAERRIEMRSGTILSSLFAATDAAGIPDAVTRQIADVFDADIDFHVDLRKGDSFRVIYETLWVNGEYLRAGRVLGIEFVTAGSLHEATWFEAQPGRGGYYAADGSSLRRAFLRSPIEFSRVSSGFSDNRLHPIHLRWKKHEGVDYAAPTGTPIRAVADGSIEFVGWKNGYGNVVMIRHSGQYETLYAHLSRFGSGIRRGARVGQGQIIGQVGATGWATGPHLHYEFHVAGRPHDPLRVALPEAAPLAAADRAAFEARHAEVEGQLALLRVGPLALR